ncbi:MAG: DUF624 domain-containing protein [Thermomicrobiales bacterium]
MNRARRLGSGFDAVLATVALLGTVIVASLLWLALSVLVVPMPAATAALFSTVGRAVAGVAGNPFADFLAGLRAHWRGASAVGGPALLLGVVIAVDALFFLGQPSDLPRGIGWLFVSLFVLWCALMLLFWPVLVFRDASTWQRLVKESFWLTMGTVPWRLGAVALCGLVVFTAVLYPVLIPFVPGVIALIGSWLALRTFHRYGLPVQL